jgi:serine/threonine-protein kinase
MAVVLALALVAAYAWWNLAWMPWHTVPDVTGAGERSALDELTVAGYDGRVTARRYDAATPTGRVLTQVPAPGSAHRARSRVGVVVSRGPAPVTVPDVRGRPGRHASRELERLGFDVRSTRSFSDDVPEGAVIAQLPGAGRAVAHGSRR